MTASAASAAEWLILAGIAGREGRAQLPLHGEPPRITDPWPRTTGSLLLAWTEARVDATAKREGLEWVNR